jgi:hypothetical protein
MDDVRRDPRSPGCAQASVEAEAGVWRTLLDQEARGAAVAKRVPGRAHQTNGQLQPRRATQALQLTRLLSQAR